MRGNITYIRDSHKRNYTCVSNEILNDQRLSAKAKGLLIQILSYPDNWYLYKSELQSGSDKRTAITSGLKELEENGYLIIRKGKFSNLSFTVIENPKDCAQNKQCNTDSDAVFEHRVCRKSDLHYADNQQLLNTNINTIVLNTTKSVDSQNYNNNLKKYISDTYNIQFTEDFYEKLNQICKERNIKETAYFTWLYETKKSAAKEISSYLYKSACNINLVNEYIRYTKQREKKLSYNDPQLICPSCGHKFTSIDFITRKCVCGLSLDEIQAKEGGSNE